MFKLNKNNNKQYKNLINGEWKESTSSRFIDIKSPIDNSLLWKVPVMTTAEVDEAIDYARVAQKEWKNKTTS